MQQIIFFFIRNKNFLLFAALFFLSVAITIRSHSFHSSKYTSSANFLSGGIYSVKNKITSYFDLKKENLKLVDENLRLRKFLANNEDLLNVKNDSLELPSNYTFMPARVINNNYARTKNLLTINRGSNDSVTIDMGVISSKGIIGIVDNLSKNYATVQSILNMNSEINVKLKHSDHFGSLRWNAKDPNITQLIDVPRLAPIAVGDTVVTGGKSTIFPMGILVGTIKNFELGEGENYYKLDIQLFNDMTNLNHVYLIGNTNKEEIKQLELEGDDAE